MCYVISHSVASDSLWPMDRKPPGSSVHGILQAWILEWTAMPFSRGSSRPRGQTQVPLIAVDSLPSEPPGKPIWIYTCMYYIYVYICMYIIHVCMYKYIYMFTYIHITNVCAGKVAQSCPIVCNPMDHTVHGILQAGILEWVAIPFSRRSSQPRDQTQVSCIAGRFFTTEPPGKPHPGPVSQIMYHYVIRN